MGIIEEATVENNLIYLPAKIEKDVFMQRKPIKSEKFYRRKNQDIIDQALRILITHKQSLQEKDLINSYMHYSKNNKDPLTSKKLKTFDESINSVIDFMQDIFRLPFCF